MAGIEFELEKSGTTELLVNYEGKRWRLSVAVHVFEISATGNRDAQGNPVFTVKAAPVMMVRPREDS